MFTNMGIAGHRLYSGLCETFLGIETRGAVPPPTAEGVHYTPLPYLMIFRMLNRLELDRRDVFVDIGCGKGRVVCCAARRDIARVVGIELNAALRDMTAQNAARVRGRRAPVESVCMSAETYEYHDASVVYLYNPFNARITSLVVDRLASARRSSRPLRLVYANPVHEGVLERGGWLRKYDEWPATEYPVFGYRVSFWTAYE